jgi:curved DNA-binding protein CbpA
MIDYFALFGLDRRPAVDLEQVKEIYFRKSEIEHPDRSGDSRLTQLNEAFQVLSDPARRLQHLVQIEFGQVGTRTITGRMSELFGRLATVLQTFDAALATTADQSSSLVRAVTLHRLTDDRSELEELLQEMVELQSRLHEEIKVLDGAWNERKSELGPALSQVALDLIFVQKWLVQIRERLLRFEEIA